MFVVRYVPVLCCTWTQERIKDFKGPLNLIGCEKVKPAGRENACQRALRNGGPNVQGVSLDDFDAFLVGLREGVVEDVQLALGQIVGDNVASSGVQETLGGRAVPAAQVSDGPVGRSGEP